MEKIKSLENVKVKTVPFELDNGDIVYVPGPWAYVHRGDPYSEGEDDREDLESEGVVGEDSDSESKHKFVARDEFGHIRLQNFLSLHQGKDHHPCELIGGHCVLPPHAFALAEERGWGSAHPFAGKFHPIVGTVIPETTLVFKAPRDAAEAAVLWELIFVSYLWAAGKIQDEEGHAGAERLCVVRESV